MFKIKLTLGLFTAVQAVFINSTAEVQSHCSPLSQLLHCFGIPFALIFFLFVHPQQHRVILTGHHLAVPALAFNHMQSFAVSTHGTIARLCHIFLTTGQPSFMFSLVPRWQPGLWPSAHINSSCCSVYTYMGVLEQSKRKGLPQSYGLWLQERKVVQSIVRWWTLLEFAATMRSCIVYLLQIDNPVQLLFTVSHTSDNLQLPKEA